MSAKFLVTEECGRLARWLRLMGYDAATTGAQPLNDVYRRAYNESRIVITRNRWVAASRLVRVIHVDSVKRDEQLRQVVRDAGLTLEPARRFTRCDRCNVEVQPLPKVQVQDRVPPYVFATQTQFHTCPICGRIYWPATHEARIRSTLETLKR